MNAPAPSWRALLARTSPRRLGLAAGLLGALAALALSLGGEGEKPAPPPPPTPPRAAPEPLELSAPPVAAAPAPPPAQEPAPAPGRLVSIPSSVEAMPGMAAPIVVRNVGGTAVVLGELVVTGGVAAASGCGGALEPGASCRIELAATAAGAGEVIGVGGSGVALRVPYRVAAPPAEAAPPRDRYAELVEAARADHLAGLGRSRIVDTAAPRSDGRLSRGPSMSTSGKPAGAASEAANYGEDYPRVVSSQPVDLSRTVLQDTPIPLVLTRSVNSQIGGPVTAMVERDVYGADGKTVVIPAGSTMHGRYEGMRRGETRLRTEFTRLVRAVDHAQFDLRASPGVGADLMGRAGLVDDLNQRVAERYGGAVIAGAIEIAGSVIEQRLARQGEGTADGQTVVVAGGQANRNAQSIARLLLERNLDLTDVHIVHGGYQFLVSPSVDLWLARPGERSADQAVRTAGAGTATGAGAAATTRPVALPPPQ
uniref:TrbI/VirB10 family protein n=1 Tax=Azospirillum argentinense TaxID=2970906 RepID=UPI001FFF0F33|nr:TrbI/VirB10 family protein [Azospirillum argentinense]